MRKIKIFTVISIIFSVLIGSFLHFAYELSGKSKTVAIFGAVNESTWEHLKIAFWPTFLFIILGWFILRKEARNYLLAQMVAVYSIPIIIVGLFYGWLLFFKDNLIWDIGIFVAAIVVGQLIAYRIMKTKEEVPAANFLAAILIAIALIAFSLFTYLAPHSFVFLDPINKGYGL